jgi:nitrate/nitrite transport system ATP-binding protein
VVDLPRPRDPALLFHSPEFRELRGRVTSHLLEMRNTSRLTLKSARKLPAWRPARNQFGRRRSLSASRQRHLALNTQGSQYGQLCRILSGDKDFPTPSGPQVIVENFNLNIEEGEFVTLIGHSGCGKSTVLNMCSGLIPVTSGAIAVALREIDGPGPDRAWCFSPRVFCRG